MQVIVQGQHINVGEALRTYIEDRITETCEKFFDHTIQSNVHLTPAPHGFYQCDITVSVGNGLVLKASADANDPYPAFDSAADKIKKRLRRYKARIRDHHKRQSMAEAVKSIPANLSVIESNEEHEEEVPENPVIVAEMETTIETLNVSDAVMRMDLGDLPALMFRDSKTGGVSVVYRRKDGNIGWIDSRMVENQTPKQVAE